MEEKGSSRVERREEKRELPPLLCKVGTRCLLLGISCLLFIGWYNTRSSWMRSGVKTLCRRSGRLSAWSTWEVEVMGSQWGLVRHLLLSSVYNQRTDIDSLKELYRRLLSEISVLSWITIVVFTCLANTAAYRTISNQISNLTLISELITQKT